MTPVADHAGLMLKAQRLVAGDAVQTFACSPGRVWVGAVTGDTGRYLVTVVDEPKPQRQSCTCTAGRYGNPCSHTTAGWLMLIRSASTQT